MNYYDYLKSDHWKQFRTRYFKKFRRACRFCGSRGQIQLHHITYKRLGRERLSDVVGLCGTCHEAIHDLYNTKEARTLAHATDIIRSRQKQVKNKFPYLAVRGKKRKQMREDLRQYRQETWDAFDYAISK